MPTTAGPSHHVHETIARAGAALPSNRTPALASKDRPGMSRNIRVDGSRCSPVYIPWTLRGCGVSRGIARLNRAFDLRRPLPWASVPNAEIRQVAARNAPPAPAREGLDAQGQPRTSGATGGFHESGIPRLGRVEADAHRDRTGCRDGAASSSPGNVHGLHGDRVRHSQGRSASGAAGRHYPHDQRRGLGAPHEARRLLDVAVGNLHRVCLRPCGESRPRRPTKDRHSQRARGKYQAASLGHGPIPRETAPDGLALLLVLGPASGRGSARDSRHSIGSGPRAGVRDVRAEIYRAPQSACGAGRTPGGQEGNENERERY